MNVPRFVRRSNIDSEIEIPNLGKEGTKREYISKKNVNGFEDQTFTSNDCPDYFHGAYIREDEDPGNGTYHPSYLVPVTKKPWIPFGKKGWLAVFKDFELDKIARKLLSQYDIANVRSARESDLNGVDIPAGKFWLSTPTTIIYNNNVCLGIKYVDNGVIKRVNLYDSSTYERLCNAEAGILAVVTTDTVIEDEEQKEGVRGLWG